MPIHLRPLSRRQFIGRTLVAGAGLTLTRKLLAETRPADPNSWALLSDTHIAADPARSHRGVCMTANFNTVARELTALPQRPVGVILTGDCAFSQGEADDYRTLEGLIEPLRQNQMPIHLLVGNHDHRERFIKAFRTDKTAPLVPNRQVSLLQTPSANWYLLDSLEQTAATPGLLGKDQLTWLAKTLDAHPDKPALVLVHHNPGLDNNIGLKDTVDFFEILRPRKQVKAYIYGHTHLWRTQREASGIHLVNLPATAYTFHEGDASGWVHATLKPKGMTLELRCVDPAHKAHGQRIDLDWRRG